MVAKHNTRNCLHIPFGCVVHHPSFGSHRTGFSYNWIGLVRTESLPSLTFISKISTLSFQSEAIGQHGNTISSGVIDCGGHMTRHTSSTINDCTHIGFYPRMVSICFAPNPLGQANPAQIA